MNAGEKQIIKDALADVADKIIFGRGGVIKARRTFFYRFGGSAEGFAKSIRTRLVTANIISADEHWVRWPGDSYWEVQFTMGT